MNKANEILEEFGTKTVYSIVDGVVYNKEMEYAKRRLEKEVSKCFSNSLSEFNKNVNKLFWEV